MWLATSMCFTTWACNKYGGKSPHGHVPHERPGASRCGGTALLKALSESDVPLQLPGSFFENDDTIGKCVRHVLALPPSNADGHGERSAHGTAARRMHHGAVQEGLCFPSQGGLCTTP